MSHKCFVSFKKEDAIYRDLIVEKLGGANIVAKSLDRWIDSNDDKYIMEQIRKDYLSDSTVTIFLIGQHSSELEGYDEKGLAKNYFIQRELQASLYNGEAPNTRNGLLGIVLPDMEKFVFRGSYVCPTCGNAHQLVDVGDGVAIREFGENYYIKPHVGCCWNEDERYAILTSYSIFMNLPEKYIELAFSKREQDVASQVKIRDLR